MPEDPAHGARHAKEMLLAIRRCNRLAITQTGEIDVIAVAAIIDGYVGGSRAPRSFIIAMAEYLATAVEHGVIRLDTWAPIQEAHIPPPRHAEGS